MTWSGKRRWRVNKDSIQTWQQGKFIDDIKYNTWSKSDKESAEWHEKFLVRPFSKGNPICQCQHPEDAIWIAKRLNLAAKILERGFSIDNLPEEMDK